MFKSFSDDKGFTLIELLVVILIIAILVAVALPNFLGQQNKAKDSSEVQRLTVAYKSAKAAITTEAAQGSFTGVAAGDIVTEINNSESPSYSVAATGPVADIADETTESGPVVVSVDGANLTLASQSRSGKECSLVASGTTGFTGADLHSALCN